MDSPFLITSQTDFPIENASLLNHSDVIKALVKFLKSENLATPLSIALQGEWGSGKTSILKTMQKKLHSKDFVIVFFEAWKHEYSNPVLALVNEIIVELTSTKETIAKIVKQAGLIFLKRTISEDIEELVKIITEEGEATSSLTTLLEKEMTKKLNGKKLIVMIDDLDRCDVKNSLMVLALVKLFLDVKNCVCIAAVDFKRLEEAWNKEYGFGKTGSEGRSYFEKIFQISISIPTPSQYNIQNFIKKSVEGDLPRDLVNIIGYLATPNPRSIKRMLNTIVFRTFILENEEWDPDNTIGQTTSIFWTLLEEILTRKGLSNVYYSLGKSISFVECMKHGDWTRVINTIKKDEKFPLTITPKIENRLKHFFKYSKEQLEKHPIDDSNLADAIETLHAVTREL